MADIRHDIFIRTMPAEVYAAITTQEGIKSWWNKETIAKPEVGFLNIFKSNGKIHTELMVTELIPGKKVECECVNGFHEWVGTQLSFELEEKDDMTLLRFTQAGWKEENDLFASCCKDWLFYLNSLKALCETGKGTPYEGTPAGPKMRAPRAVADTEKGMILASADIDMPAECVFRALSSAAEIERWWGSADTYRMTDWMADFRVGGRYQVVVRRQDGKDFPASGEFLEIDAPRKLAHTRKYEWEFPVLGRRETTITYRLDPIVGGTRLSVRHEGFAGCSEAAYEHAEGWERVLGWLLTNG